MNVTHTHTMMMMMMTADVNPKTRFTAEQALSHPWVAGRSVQPNNYLQSPSLLGTYYYLVTTYVYRRYMGVNMYAVC